MNRVNCTVGFVNSLAGTYSDNSPQQTAKQQTSEEDLLYTDFILTCEMPTQEPTTISHDKIKLRDERSNAISKIQSGCSLPQLRKTITSLYVSYLKPESSYQRTQYKTTLQTPSWQLCSRTPGDDTRAEGRIEKAQLLKGARPPTGQTAHRSRKDFWPTISCDRSPSLKTTEGGRAGQKTKSQRPCKTGWTRGQ